MAPSSYQAVIGLEVHVQLRTRTKIFCRCPHRFGAEPNSLVCPVCFDSPRGVTRTLRNKEVDRDYRYFPEPDLPPIVLSEERLERLTAALPRLPWQRRRELRDRFQLTPESACALASEQQLCNYFEAAAVYSKYPSSLSSWVRGELLRKLKECGKDEDWTVPPQRLTRLVDMVEEGEISRSSGKRVFEEILRNPEEPEQTVDRLGLRQVCSDARLLGWIDQVLKESEPLLFRYRLGETRLLGHFVGQVMGRSEGRAHPGRLREFILQRIDDN